MNLTVRPVTVRAEHGPRQIAPQVMHTLCEQKKGRVTMVIAEESDRVKKGDRFISYTSHHIRGLTSWKIPYTGGFKCTLPPGTILVAMDDQLETASAFGALPENYEEIEIIVVPSDDRGNSNYAGYHLVIDSKKIGHGIERIKSKPGEHDRKDA